MAQRMTPAEVAAELRRMASDAKSVALRGTGVMIRDELWRLARQLPRLVDLAEQHLTPQVLDEPDGDGWHWVEGLGVRLVLRVGLDFETFPLRESIKGRRVAKVPPGPFAENGGKS